MQGVHLRKHELPDRHSDFPDPVSVECGRRDCHLAVCSRFSWAQWCRCHPGVDSHRNPANQLDGYGYTNGSGLMAGHTWGLTSLNVISPRLLVTNPSATILGTYQSDNQVSSALKHVGNFESIFIGEFALGAFANSISGATPSEDVLRALLQIAGVHIWSTAGDVVITDGNLLVIHAAAARPDAISLPPGISATPLGGGPSSTGTLNINLFESWRDSVVPTFSALSRWCFFPGAPRSETELIRSCPRA
jgi:hypothetical protein